METLNTPLCLARHLPLKGGDWLSEATATTENSCTALMERQSPPLRGRWPTGQRGVTSAVPTTIHRRR